MQKQGAKLKIFLVLAHKLDDTRVVKVYSDARTARQHANGLNGSEGKPHMTYSVIKKSVEGIRRGNKV